MQGRGSIAAPAPHPIPALTGSGLRFASDQFLLTIPITSSTIISPASLRSDPPDRNPRNSDRLPSGLLIALAGIRSQGFGVTQRDVYTYLNGSSSGSLVETKYTLATAPGGQILTGTVTETKEYNFGATLPPSGTPAKDTITSYGSWNGSSCVPIPNISDHPCVVTLLDSSGSTAAQTKYTYNNGGHPTQVSRLIGGSTYATSFSAYQANGARISSTDAIGTLTTIVNGLCNNLLPSQTTVGGLTTSLNWDCNGGVLTSTTDANTNVTLYSHKDPFWRLTSTQYPDGGQTNVTYNSLASPPNITTTQLITASIPPLTRVSYFDGLGQVVKTALTSDQEGSDFVDTTYDGLGRMLTVSNPYRSTGDLTFGITTYQYDALGRITQVAPPDGTAPTPAPPVNQCLSNNYCAQYSNNVKTIMDQSGHQRQSITDGLGRLAEVDEPGDPSTFLANNHGNLAQDGNFAVFGPAGDIKWQSNTHGATNTFYSINMMDDGNLIKYTPTWNTATPTSTGTVGYGTQACVGYRLFSGQTLGSGQCLQSLNKRFMLVMQTAGNLVLYDLSFNPAHAIFFNSTTGVAGSYLAMQGDGNLVIYTSSGSPVWSTGSATGTGNYMLQVQDPGNLVIYRDIWETSTSQAANGVTNFTPVSCSNLGSGIFLNQNIPMGSCLISNSGRFVLVMQTDGNLVVYDRSNNPLRAIWNTATGIVATPLSPGVALQTLYSYDALNNLLCVEQHGNVAGTGCSASPTSDATSSWRVRRFTYDSLSRLLSASNPESNTARDSSGNPIRVPTHYSYDANGNLLQQTSPAPNQTSSATQTISYCYDALSRVTGKAYSAQACPLSTPVATYTYDVAPNGKGKLTSLTDQAGLASYTYDSMGRTKTAIRITSGISKQFSYDYNLDGSLWKLHYPSGRVVTYTPNSAGHVVAASDSTGTTYVSSASYYANGAEYQRHTPLVFLQTTLNRRLQPFAIYSDNGLPGPAFINKTYVYGAPSQNTENITSIVDNEDSSRTQTFTYDSLDRITTGSSGATTGTYSWGETYAVDPWGNLTFTPMANKAHGGSFANAADTSNHVLGLGYDAAGNVTGYLGSYVYDPENRIASAPGETYTYDADGQRILKKNSGTGAIIRSYWRGAGNVLAEADSAGNLTAEYVFWNGARNARIDLPTGTVHYYLSDHLGSSKKIINSAGTVEEESDYTAFGAELTGVQGSNHYKFTGKERDTTNDYFGARYYSSLMGRWMSADPSTLGVDINIPQTWNRYNQSVNNPLSIKDDTGLWPFYVHENIIDESFPGMSKEDLEALKTASWAMDYAAHQQDPGNSFMHGMYDDSGTEFWGGGNDAHDDARANAFISDQVDVAQRAQADWIAQGHTGFAPAALTAFGNALHTTTDRTSPAHEGPQGWKGKPWYYPSSLWHGIRESRRLGSRAEYTDSAAQQVFIRTFGHQFDYLLLMNQGRPCVSWQDRISGTGGGHCE
jgi:RHS repeat-associated protein